MKKRFMYALILMGFTFLIIQVLLIREFMVCFYGNELIIGIILANWIALQAIGSNFSSRLFRNDRNSIISYGLTQFLIAIYLPIAVFLIYNLRNMLSIATGQAMSVTTMMWSSLLILLPLGIIGGAQFPLGCRLYKDLTKDNNPTAGRVYTLEAIGFIIAGPIFTYLFIQHLNPFQIALIVGLLNLFSGFLILQKGRKSLSRNILTISICLAIIFSGITLFPRISDSLNRISLEKQWKGWNLLDSKNSIYGNIAVTKEKEQYTYYNDGIPIITTPNPDTITNEEFIHFSMLSHANPQDVLIVSGGLGGAIKEILKYPIKSLDYTELDPLLIKMVKEYSTGLTQEELNDPHLALKIVDGVQYVKTSPKKYDVVFINLPHPTSLQLNRYYTKELFLQIKNILKDDGLLAFKLPGSLTYISTELGKLNLSILNSINGVFRFVEVIPGDRNLYISSQSKLITETYNIIRNLELRNVHTQFLTQFHIKERLSNSWKQWFYRSLANINNVKDNSSLLPIGLFYGLNYWNASFSPFLVKLFNLIEEINLIPILICIGLLTLFAVLFIKKEAPFRNMSLSYAMFTTGFLGMSFELIFIFTYQSFYGYIYQYIALLITSFMLGLAIGSILITKNIQNTKKKLLVLIESSLVLFSIAIIPLFSLLSGAKTNTSFIFFVLTVVAGFLVGAEFPLINNFYKNKSVHKTGFIYAIDLVGSYFGALIVTAALIPVLGLIKACVLLAAIKLSSLILITRTRLPR